MRVSAQRMADQFPHDVLAHLSALRIEVAARPHPPLSGIRVIPEIIAEVEAEGIAQELFDARVHKACDEAAIRASADNYARQCARAKSLDGASEIARLVGIEPPEVKGRTTPAGALARLREPHWWRRQLRRAWTRSAADAKRRIGMVRKGRAPYVTDEEVRHWENRQRGARSYLESREAVNEQGELLPLIDIHERSLANPPIRRGEFMVWVKGLEKLAGDVGHVAQFYTLTAPSAFHPQLSAAAANPRYEGKAVRDAQDWLNKQWRRVRSKLHRLAIFPYGVRVAEPHHDGTPHWHVLMFVPAQHADTVRAVIFGYWRSDYREEMTTEAALEARAQCIAIDREKGSAVGYIAKYLAKNIDACGTIGEAESDETGEPVAMGARRVAAWASTYGIRQFCRFGGPPVGLYRELRRRRDPVEGETLEAVRTAADTHDIHAFILALGGLERARKRPRCVKRKYSRECEVTAANADEWPRAWLEKREPTRPDHMGRELPAMNRYGEPMGERVCGAVAFGLLGRWASVDTRPHRWRIERKAHPVGNVATLAKCDTGRYLGGSHRTPFHGASLSESSSAAGALFSPLGPVAITVRGPLDGAESAGERDYSWIATVPYRPPSRGSPH